MLQLHDAYDFYDDYDDYDAYDFRRKNGFVY